MLPLPPFECSIGIIVNCAARKIQNLVRMIGRGSGSLLASALLVAVSEMSGCDSNVCHVHIPVVGKRALHLSPHSFHLQIEHFPLTLFMSSSFIISSFTSLQNLDSSVSSFRIDCLNTFSLLLSKS